MALNAALTVSERYQRYVNLSAVGGLEPISIVRAQGAQVWDSQGRDYLDCFAGISVVNTGHCHPAVIRAARAQMDQLIHCGSYLYEVPVLADLAEKLAAVTPGSLQKTFFSNSGAEAIEGALRLAKAFTGRHEFIALESGFHGRTNATLSVTGNRKRKQRGGPYLPGVAFAPAPHPYRCRFCNGKCSLACADAVRDVIDFDTSGDVAAFIAEPIMGEGGLIVPHDAYFERVKSILDDYGILFIADEVQTGFGRTGLLFGIEHYGVVPDIMVMAKGIASGFPLSGFIAAPDLADSFQPGEHLSTFGGNPVSCAAALATLEVIESERLCERSADLGRWLLAQFESLADRHALIGDVRGRGLMIGVELVSNRSEKVPSPEAAMKVKAQLRERGVLIGVGGFYGNVLRFQPPLVVEPGQLEFALEALDGLLSSIAE